MIAPRWLDKEYLDWNERRRAPSGRNFWKTYIPKRYWLNPLLGKMVGSFAFQPNNSNRTFEYPWAYYHSDIKGDMKIVDIGGGFSGFPFALSAMGSKVINVDPFISYGPCDHYQEDPNKVIRMLNRICGTDVELKRQTLESAGFEDNSIDRIVCISVIEHLSDEDIKETVSEARRILKPGGLFILTVDLFLDCVPFTKKRSNEHGHNISIKQLVDNSGLQLIHGVKEELNGYSEFDPERIVSNLSRYLLSREVPLLTQAFVLKKE